MIELEKNGDIKYNGKKIGVIEWNGNTLLYIFIERKYRNNGYATEAIKQLVEYIKKDGYDYIQTTTVLNNSMEKVLQKNKFKPKEKETIDVPNTIEHSMGVEIPQDTTPMKNDNCWIRIL